MVHLAIGSSGSDSDSSRGGAEALVAVAAVAAMAHGKWPLFGCAQVALRALSDCGGAHRGSLVIGGAAGGHTSVTPARRACQLRRRRLAS